MPKKNCPANKPHLKKEPSTGRQVKVVSSAKKHRSISITVDVQVVDVQVKTHTAK